MPHVFRMRYQKPHTRTLYYLFCIMGGFYSTDVVTPAARNVWWIMNVLSLLYGVVIGPIGYLLTETQHRLTDVLYVFIYAVGHVYAGIYTPLITHYFRNELKAIIENMDSEFDCRRPEARVADVQRRRYDSIAVARRWFVWMMGLIILMAAIRPAYTILICGSSCLRSQRFYSEATPFTEHVHSLWLYLAISIVQGIHYMYAGSLPYSNVLFSLITGYEFHNLCVNLIVRLEHATNDAISQLREPRTRGPELIPVNSNDDSGVFEQFTRDVAAIVERYEKLGRAIETLRIWIEIFVTINVVNFFGICTTFAYFVLGSAFEPLLRFLAVIGFIAMGSLTYGCCLLGKVFDDTNEMLIDEVYATRWYELPPKYRQMVHILHGQIRRPIQFRVFVVYPVTMATFARALRFVYSVINILKRPQI